MAIQYKNEKPFEQEVVDLHVFFEGWIAGRLEKTKDGFQRVEDVMASGFEIVFPSGVLVGRDELLKLIWDMHGRSKDDNPPFKLWTDRCRATNLDDGITRVTYIEWQRVHGDTVGRRSTAILRYNASCPNELEWLHVHETWLDANLEEEWSAQVD